MHASSVVGSDQASAITFTLHACCYNCCFIRTNHVSSSSHWDCHRALQHTRVFHRSRRSRRPPEARQRQASTCTQQRDLHVLESSSRFDAEHPHAQSGESEQAETLVCHWGLWKCLPGCICMSPPQEPEWTLRWDASLWYFKNSMRNYEWGFTASSALQQPAVLFDMISLRGRFWRPCFTCFQSMCTTVQ